MSQTPISIPPGSLTLETETRVSGLEEIQPHTDHIKSQMEYWFKQGHRILVPLTVEQLGPATQDPDGEQRFPIRIYTVLHPTQGLKPKRN